MPTLKELALDIARGYIGQKETPAGSNAGEFVEGCLKLVGLGKGFAWCMAFVFRVYHEAATQLKVANPVPKTAGVMDCWRKAPAACKVLKKSATKYNVPAGSQLIMDFGKGTGHTALVISIEGDTIHTIEGNTDANGSRTGGMVCQRTRSMKDTKVVGFIVYLDTSTEPIPVKENMTSNTDEIKEVVV